VYGKFYKIKQLLILEKQIFAFISGGLAFRCIPDEESGDAASIQFRYLLGAAI
jgi:hypothetical protein